MDGKSWMDELRTGMDRFNPGSLIFLSLILLVLFFSDMFDTVYNPRTDANYRTLFFVLYEYNIRRVFQHQGRETHEILYRGVEGVLRPGMTRPRVISLVSVGRGASCTALSLSRAMATVIMHILSPFGVASPSKYMVRCRNYTSADDYWDFNATIISSLIKYRVTVLTDFECLHPQVATLLSVLANEATLPQTQTIIMVILNTGERFQVRKDGTRSREVCQTAVRECLGPFLGAEELDCLVETLTWMSCTVTNEPTHRPSTCTVCNPAYNNMLLSPPPIPPQC